VREDYSEARVAQALLVAPPLPGTRAVRRLQQTYLEESVMLDPAACASRSARERFQEDAARLVGPVR
jgi:hypothetical protein